MEEFSRAVKVRAELWHVRHMLPRFEDGSVKVKIIGGPVSSPPDSGTFILHARTFQSDVLMLRALWHSKQAYDKKILPNRSTI
jgi:hypothetical protein